MTVTELLVIVCGLAIGYWFVGVFLTHSRAGRDGAAPSTTVDIGATGWHEVLGVAPDAGRDAIEDAYRRRKAEYDEARIAGLAPELRALAAQRSIDLDVAYDRALMHLHDHSA